MLETLDQQIRDAYQPAHDCADRAKTAVTPQERNDWLFVGARWLTLAHSLEFTRPAERFFGEAKRNQKRE
jgi:hypothetical protein